MRKTVEPRVAARRMIVRTSARPTGSSAEVGSSRMTRLGSTEQRHAQAEALLHALRERADDIVGAVGQADVARARPRSAPAAARSADDRAASRACSSSTSRARSQGW